MAFCTSHSLVQASSSVGHNIHEVTVCCNQYNKNANPMPFMDEVIANLNAILTNPTLESILSLFEPEAHIRFNNIFISPITLIDFKTKLDSFGLVSWEVIEDGILFQFERTFIHFQGFYEIFNRMKLFSFELNFEPVTSTDEGRLLMNEIEVFLRKCDALFFLCYTQNVDAVILHNPLSNSVPFLAKRAREDLNDV